MPHPLSAAAEDCLKAIYLLADSTGQASVGALADRLGVTPASVSAMLRRLAQKRVSGREDEENQAETAPGSSQGQEGGITGGSETTAGIGPYVILEPYRGVTLTQEGQLVALHVLRCHRLLELFLVRELDVPLDRAHTEAECLEHDLSEDLEERLAAKLGHPTRGIHGKPIPRHDGTFPTFTETPLSELAIGSKSVVIAIPPDDPDLVQYLLGLGMTSGALVTSSGVIPYSDSLLIHIGDNATPCPLSMTVAEHVLVQLVKPTQN